MRWTVRPGAARRSVSAVLVLAVALSMVVAQPAAAILVNNDIPFAAPTANGATIEGTVMTMVTNEHRVYSIALAADDVLTVAGGYDGGPGMSLSLRLFGPTATSVNEAPLAVAPEPVAKQPMLEYTATTAGTYYIDVMYSNSVGLGYTFAVNTGGAGGGITPEVTFEPDLVSFETTLNGPPPASQTVTVTIDGWETPEVDWYLYDIPEWLTITPSFGTAPGTTAMLITIDFEGLEPGDYTQNIQVGVDVPSMPSSFGSGVSRSAEATTSYGQLPISLKVASDVPKVGSQVASFAVSPAYPGRTGSATPKATLSGALVASGKVETDTALAGQVIEIQRSYDNVTYSKVATVATDADGGFAYQAYVAKKTYFKAVFGGNAYLDPATPAGPVACTPYAYLTAPVTPSTVYRGRTFTTAGYVYPGHTSTYPVRLYYERYQRKSDGSYGYVYKKSVAAKRVAGGSTYAKYAAATYVPYTGRWRVRAVHADSDHRTSYSGYRYFSVR